MHLQFWMPPPTARIDGETRGMQPRALSVCTSPKLFRMQAIGDQVVSRGGGMGACPWN